MAFEIKKKDSSDVVEPEIVSDSSTLEKTSSLSPEDKSRLVQGGLKITKDVAQGVVDIYKIRVYNFVYGGEAEEVPAA